MAAVAARRQPDRPPPNLSQYYEDDVLEGPKLSRALGWALICSAVLAASLPVYWLLEPTRQTKMNKDFLADSILRGRERFAVAGSIKKKTEVLQLECARCHGPTAEGGD